MRISYDKTIKLAGIGMVPWVRLGLENWFNDYSIITLNPWDVGRVDGAPRLFTLGKQVKLAKRNTQYLVQASAFKSLCDALGEDCLYLPYKPVVIKDPKLRRKFLMNDPKFTKTYENKVVVRELLKDKVQFAPYKIFDVFELAPTQEHYAMLQEVSPYFVMQHEQLSGGKGTYLVRSFEDYTKALRNLPSGKIVVSALIPDAKERSIQCCATRYTTLCGAPQKQIIRDPLLSNLELQNPSVFGGAEIAPETFSEIVQQQITEYTAAIGKQMYDDGYKGIFGVDLLIQGETVYVLEVNARVTGVTPLLTALYRSGKDIPFYLLHTLEFANIPYTIDDLAVEQPESGGLLLLQNHNSMPMRLSKVVESGIYRFDDDALQFVRRDFRFRKQDVHNEILIQAYVPAGTILKPGDRVASIFTRELVLDQEVLNKKYTKLVKDIYGQLGFEPLSVKMNTMNTRITVGSIETVSFPDYDLSDIETKIDTGAMSAVLHTTKVHEEERDGQMWLVFSPFDHPEKTIKTKKYFTRKVRSSNGHTQTRYFINTQITLHDETYPIMASLTDRSSMKYPMLIGKRFLQEQNILVDLNLNKV